MYRERLTITQQRLLRSGIVGHKSMNNAAAGTRAAQDEVSTHTISVWCIIIRCFVLELA